MLDLYPVGTGLELANGHVCPAYGHLGQDYRLSTLDPYQALIAAHRDRGRVQEALLSTTPPGGTGAGVVTEANQLATVAVITLGLARLAPGEPPTTADAWRIVGNTGLTARQVLREATHCVATPDCPGVPIGILRRPDGSRGVSCQGHAGNPRLWSFVF